MRSFSSTPKGHGRRPRGRRGTQPWGRPRPAAWHADLDQGSHRRRRPADHGGVQGSRASRRFARRDRRPPAARCRRRHHRQDEPSRVRPRHHQRGVGVRAGEQPARPLARRGRVQRWLSCGRRHGNGAGLDRQRHRRLDSDPGGRMRRRRPQADRIGEVPTDGVVPLSSTFDNVGPITTSVRRRRRIVGCPRRACRCRLSNRCIHPR